MITNQSLVEEVRALLRQDQISEALNLVNRSRPANGARRESLQLIFSRIGSLPKGERRNGLVKSLCEIGYRINDAEILNKAIPLIEGSTEPYEQVLQSLIHDQISEAVDTGQGDKPKIVNST